MAKKFRFDNPNLEGMTVEQLLNLTNEDLNNMTKRDISRVTRTVSLVANKRLDRLLQHSEKVQGEYVPKKGDKTHIDPYALNMVLEESKRKSGSKEGFIQRFSASKDTKNQLRVEFNRARRFMNMKTSTIGGSVANKAAREKRATGYTQAEYVEKKLKEGVKPEVSAEEFERLEKKAYGRFRRYNEYRVNGGDMPRNYMGSDEVLAMIKDRTMEGRRITNKKLAQFEEEGYIKEIELEDEELAQDFAEAYDFGSDDLPFEVFTDDDNDDYWT